jgi:FtsZ-interacting cell division protein ZipA
VDLHLALLALGLVLIVIIFALSRYSNVIEDLQQKWQKNRELKKRDSERKVRDAENAPKFADSAQSDVQDESPLFDYSSDSIEANDITEDNVLLSREVDDATLEVEQHRVEDQQLEEETTSLKEAEEEVGGPFTSLRQIDYWIKLSPAEQHTQAQILEKLNGWDKIAFPVQLHALTLENPKWVSLLDSAGDVEIMDVVASYQLLHKGEATSLEDLSIFDELVTQLGTALEAEKLVMATPQQALEQSQQLADFHNNHCESLEVTIRAPQSESFMGKLVETSAKQQGLEFKDGEYVRMKKMGAQDIILYRMLAVDADKFDEDMSSDSMIKSVKFSMLPALSPKPGRDAKEMLDAVKAFASRVKGEIRVPGKPEFHLDQLLNLRNSVSQLEDDMTNAGLEPGGPELQRIFS